MLQLTKGETLIWRPNARSLLGSTAAVLGCLLASCAATATNARAAGDIELVRTYNSSKGTVFEVCRGVYKPPVTDPFNPAYCRGTVERWTQAQWQAYNRRQSGASGGAGGGGGSKSKGGKGKHPGATGPVAVGTQPAEGGAAPPTSFGGSLDPITVLGIQNPLCGERRNLSAAQIRNCRSSQSPEAEYPPGNYGWDIHIESGGFVTSLLAPVASLILLIASVIWLIFLLILKGCLIILGFTFSLSPFTDNAMLREISNGLERFFRYFTSPWLTSLFVILGTWGLFNGIVRRRAGETVSGMIVALVMMLGAMWIIHAPQDTVGRFARIINQASLAAVSAPSSGRVNAPARSYNDAMARVWNQITEVPFCAMNFSDVHWCMNAKPSEDALEAAKGGLDANEGNMRLLLNSLPDDEDQARRTLNRYLAGMFGPAPTIRDLYLRFSPQSGPRDALWAYYHGTPDNEVGLPLGIGPQLNVGGGTSGAAPEKVEMQGRSGLPTRLLLVVVFAIGLIGGLALLLWIAMKLVMAAAASFVLVLATPLAMFFPVFGQAGRAAFVRWLTSLIGAIVAKLIFSALLGIVLLGSSVLGAGIGGSSPTLGLIATMAFWWSVFLSRERFLALLQIDPIRDQGNSLYRTMAGGYIGYRIAKAAKNAISRRRDERDNKARREEVERSEHSREAANDELHEQAQQRLDVATDGARARDAYFTGVEGDVKRMRQDPDVRALRQDPSRMSDSQRHYAERKAAELRRVEEEAEQLRPQAAADRQVLNRVRANEAQGLPRHGRAEIEGAKDAIRRESRLPANAPEHRWRAEAVGKDPQSVEGRQAIADSLARAQAATTAIPHERVAQVDLHRIKKAPGGQRQKTTRAQKGNDPPGGSGEAPGPSPEVRAKRRSSIQRGGLSR